MCALTSRVKVRSQRISKRWKEYDVLRTFEDQKPSRERWHSLDLEALGKNQIVELDLVAERVGSVPRVRAGWRGSKTGLCLRSWVGARSS